jgi:Mg2+-importing ATPase
LSGTQQLAFIALFHAGWFVESLWTQTLVLHALRTPKIPFLESRAAFGMTFVTSAGILTGSVLPFTSFGRNLGLAQLPLAYWLVLGATILLYLLLVTMVKKHFIQRNGELL